MQLSVRGSLTGITMKINACALIKNGSPYQEGGRLCDALIDSYGNGAGWRDLEIDVSDVPPEILITTFFRGFLERAHDVDRNLLPTVRILRWAARYDYQKRMAEDLMRSMQPEMRAAGA
jgi:hypothetical protein